MLNRIAFVCLLLALSACNTREFDALGVNGKAELKVVNDSDTPVHVLVDGRFEGTVAPGVHLDLGVRPGRREVRGEFAGTDEVVRIDGVRLRSWNRQTIIFRRPPFEPQVDD